MATQTNKEQEYLLEIKELKEKLSRLENKSNYDYEHLDQIDIDGILDEVEKMEEEKHEELEEKKKTKEFWKTLDKKLREADIEYIKDLVRNKELNMNEVNEDGRNLLMLASYYGKYELVAMCINLGADIDLEDKKKKTAEKIAKQNGFPDIEELLIMNLLKTELGQRIEDTTNDLSRKQGITNNFNKILNDLSHENKNENNDQDEKYEKYEYDKNKRQLLTHKYLRGLADLFKEELLETLLTIIIESIEQKIAFSDDILYIAFYYEINIQKKLPINTLLYQTIEKVVLQILSDTKK